MSRRCLGTTEACWDGSRVSQPKGCWPIPSKTRHLVLRKGLFVHREYRNHIQLIHSSVRLPAVQAGSRARLTAVKHVTPTPRCNLKVIESIWRLKIPRKRTCEHPRRLDSAAYILTDEESKLVSRTCGGPPQFTLIPLILDNIQKSHCKMSQIGRIR